MNQWNKLTTEEDFYALVEKSAEKPQLIFKDSLTCGISAYAKEKLVLSYDLIDGKADFNYLDLLNHRSISNLIAQVLGVTHQSPQIIILKDRQVTHHWSHHAIDARKISTVL